MVKKNKSILKEFVEISKYFGQRFDLNQAAGGNSSIKIGNQMYIKSSGYSLSEVSSENGYAILNNDELISFLDKIRNKKVTKSIDRKSSTALKESVLYGSGPSIETYTHTLLKKFTIHIHPIAINMVSVDKKSEEIFNKIVAKRKKDEGIFHIGYYQPGIVLANEINKVISKEQKAFREYKTVIFFLENHGLICSASSKSELIDTVERFVSKFEDYLKMDLNRYKMTTKISEILWNCSYKNLTCYYSEDSYIQNNISLKNSKSFKKPLSPDQFLYCGEAPLIVSRSLKGEIVNHIKKYKTFPRVIILKKDIYFVAANVLKAREKEDVFKAQLYFNSKSNPNRPLSKNEVKKLTSYNLFKNRLRFWFDYTK
ncbi:hypothetical protein HN460_00875 [bacterium]|jgi:rhamnose utilization protein RhaD (predicted bifunctional aldolase and dehydrogenase)|nr:hypothetical protein [bacterium]MBT3795452.1 hypothetical protein [bacterium]MBT4633981.1 hypothetical protein [bacterium]